jgi:hypothetical protein
MSAEHTCVNELFGRAPEKRVLRGDKSKAIEPGTHILEFPGGAVEVSRLRDGSYWAHIIVNRRQALPIFEGREAAFGVVVDSRIDWEGRGAADIPGLPDGSHLTQVAVRIAPEFPPAVRRALPARVAPSSPSPRRQTPPPPPGPALKEPARE